MSKISLERFLSIAYLVPMGDPLDPACDWGQPVALRGEPGIGKTDRIFQSGATLNLPVQVIELGGRQPEDASGAPFLNKKDELVIACLLQQVNILNAAGRGVLFLDEFNWGRPATQGAFTSMVRARRIGDTILSNFIRIVMAGNPPAAAGGGYQLIPPMANRLAHFDVDTPTDEEEDAYLMGQAQTNVVSIDDGEKKIMDGWANEWAKQKGIMMGFYRRFPQHKFHRPKESDPQIHKAWPTPRSRENAIRCVTTCIILGENQDVQDEFFEACVGKKAATDWAIWRHEADLPDPLDMLTNGWKPNKQRLDISMAAYGSAVAYVIGRSNPEQRKELAIPMWDLLGGAVGAGIADIAYSCAQGLVRNKLGLSVGGQLAETAKKVMLRFGKKDLHTFGVDP